MSLETYIQVKEAQKCKQLVEHMENEEFSQDDFFPTDLAFTTAHLVGIGMPSVSDEMPFPVARESSGQLFHSGVKVSGSTGRVNLSSPLTTRIDQIPGCASQEEAQKWIVVSQAGRRISHLLHYLLGGSSTAVQSKYGEIPDRSGKAVSSQSLQIEK